MAKLFDFTIKNGAAGGFGMFSAAHFAWLAVLLAAGGGVCLAYKEADQNSTAGHPPRGGMGRAWDGTSARGAAVRGGGI